MPGKKITSIAEAKANKSRDSTLWTPAEMLKAILGDIESGEINPTKICVHYFEDKEDRCTHGFYAANLSFEEHIALLTVALNSTVEDWRC